MRVMKQNSPWHGQWFRTRRDLYPAAARRKPSRVWTLRIRPWQGDVDAALRPLEGDLHFRGVWIKVDEVPDTAGSYFEFVRHSSPFLGLKFSSVTARQSKNS